VPARGGGGVVLGYTWLYYKPFLIYRTCMRRALARPVRACFVQSCCGLVVQEHDLSLCATQVQCNAKRHSSHCILHTPHSTLHTCTSSQLISSELFLSHFMSSQMSAKLFLTIFILSTHMAAKHSNIHAAIPMRSATRGSTTA